MNPDLCLQVREHTLQGIVCSWKSGPGIFLKRPEPLHVAPNAQVCAPETGTHVRRCFLFYPPVLDTLVQNVPVPRIPVLEGGCERPAVHFCDAAHKIKKVPRCIQLGILREVAPDYKHLVELTHLHGIRTQHLGQAPHAVRHHSVYPESMRPEERYPLHVVRYRLVSDILTPQYPVAEGILYHHQAEIAAPVGGVHLDGHVLHRDYFLDIPHAEQVAAYRPDRHPVSQR